MAEGNEIAEGAPCVMTTVNDFVTVVGAADQLPNDISIRLGTCIVTVMVAVPVPNAVTVMPEPTPVAVCS